MTEPRFRHHLNSRLGMIDSKQINLNAFGSGMSLCNSQRGQLNRVI